jgi:hypothetical protein
MCPVRCIDIRVYLLCAPIADAHTVTYDAPTVPANGYFGTGKPHADNEAIEKVGVCARTDTLCGYCFSFRSTSPTTCSPIYASD